MKEIPLTALLDAFHFSDTPEMLQWLRSHGVAARKIKATTTRGRYAGRRVHWHWVVSEFDALRLWPLRATTSLNVFPLPKPKPLSGGWRTVRAKIAPIRWINAKRLVGILEFATLEELVGWLEWRGVDLQFQKGEYLLMSNTAAAIAIAYREGKHGWLGLEPKGILRTIHFKDVGLIYGF